MSAANESDVAGNQQVPPAPTPAVSGNTPNEDSTGNGSEVARRRPYNPNRRPGNTSSTFKGETSKLNGNVFQVHSERTDMSQFAETLEALRIYSSYAYKSDIEFLTVLFTSLQTPTVSKPEDPEETTSTVDGKEVRTVSKFEEMRYSENVKQWIRDDKSLKATTRSLYYIIIGQCSKLMRNKITLSKDYVRFEKEGDVAALLKEIRRISLQMDTNTSVYDALDEAKMVYYTYRQDANESNAKHLRNFKSIVAAIEHQGGQMFADDALMIHEKKIDTLVGTNVRTDKEKRLCVREKMMGIALLKRGKGKYEKLIQAIRDQHAFGVDVYPKTLHDAYELMESHSAADDGANDGNRRTRRERDAARRERGRGRDGRGRGRGRGGGGQTPTSGFQFAQEEEIVPGTDGRVIERITCFRCLKRGHFADMCPNTEIGASHNIIAAEESVNIADHETDEREVSVCNNNEWVNLQEEDAVVNEDSTSEDDSLVVAFQYMEMATNLATNIQYSDTDILLDTGSTMSVFKNKRMLLNVRKSKRVLRAYSNGGHQDSDTVGDFPGMFTVWHNPRSMLNILAFCDVRKKFRVTMDTGVDNIMYVHLPRGGTLKFEEVKSGLYLLRSNNDSNKNISAYSFLTLVKSNKENFTTREVKRADMARKFRKYLGYPSYKRYFKLLEDNYFIDYPLTVDDAKRALHIYGPDIES